VCEAALALIDCASFLIAVSGEKQDQRGAATSTRATGFCYALRVIAAQPRSVVIDTEAARMRSGHQTITAMQQAGPRRRRSNSG